MRHGKLTGRGFAARLEMHIPGKAGQIPPLFFAREIPPVVFMREDRLQRDRRVEVNLAIK